VTQKPQLARDLAGFAKNTPNIDNDFLNGLDTILDNIVFNQQEKSKVRFVLFFQIIVKIVYRIVCFLFKVRSVIWEKS
jgi:hypothetical protein